MKTSLKKSIATSKKVRLAEQENFLEAFRVNSYNITSACKAMGIARNTYYNWCDEVDIDKEGKERYPFKEKVLKVREELLDFAENQLFKRMKGYDHEETKVFQEKGQIITHTIIRHYPPDPTSLIFFLKTQAKKRGYIEHAIQEVREIKTININIVAPSDAKEVLGDFTEAEISDTKKLTKGENDE